MAETIMKETTEEQKNNTTENVVTPFEKNTGNFSRELQDGRKSAIVVKNGQESRETSYEDHGDRLRRRAHGRCHFRRAWLDDRPDGGDPLVEAGKDGGRSSEDAERKRCRAACDGVSP